MFNKGLLQPKREGHCQHNWLAAVVEVIGRRDSEGRDHVFQETRGIVCGNCHAAHTINLPIQFIEAAVIAAPQVAKPEEESKNGSDLKVH